jgi:alkylation response protein AidB-like acyl-CoA dehydrogenase
MIWQLNDEQRMIQMMVREFARKEIEPRAPDFDRKGRFPAEIVKKMGELGLMGMMVPARLGGSEAGAVSYSLALQEIAYSCSSCAVTMSVSNLSCEPLLQFGTEEQQVAWLPQLAGGKALGAFALTEPEAGSDPGSLRTAAKKSGSAYRLNGTKVFITNGAYADLTVLIARTRPEGGNKNLTAFLIPKGTPGFQVGPEEEKMGLKASNTVTLFLEDCLVPEGLRIGREGDGFRVAMTALDSGRIGIASQATGLGHACLDEAVRYSQERKQFGRFLSSFQAIAWMIADMATELEAARLLTLQAASLKDQGLPFTRVASMAKLYASEMANRAAYSALQIHGGYGYTQHFKVERLYRDARVATLYEGTSEIQRLVISRETLAGPV